MANQNNKNQEVKLLFKDGSREKELKKEKKHGLPDFEVTDLIQEEDRESMMVEITMKKYHKILKYLFVKYANTGHSNKKVNNFDQYGDKSDTISIPEIWNFIKDFQLDS